MSNELTQEGIPDEFAQKVIAIIADTQRIPPEKISLESKFDELGLDSLDAVSIVFELELEFNISIPNDEALVISTVRQAVESLRKLLPKDIAGAKAVAQS